MDLGVNGHVAISHASCRAGKRLFGSKVTDAPNDAMDEPTEKTSPRKRVIFLTETILHAGAIHLERMDAASGNTSLKLSMMSNAPEAAE